MKYLVRKNDQWGEICYVIDGDRIWEDSGPYGLADIIIEPNLHNNEEHYVKRENTWGEKLYFVEPNRYGEGYYIKKKDSWGEKLYFVEESRRSPGEYLVREGDQHGSVAFYVQKCSADDAGPGGKGYGKKYSETMLGKIHSAVLTMIYDAILLPKKRFGRNGAVVAMLCVQRAPACTIPRIVGAPFHDAAVLHR